MTEADRKAFEIAWHGTTSAELPFAAKGAAEWGWQAALTHARGKQELIGYIVTEYASGEFCDPLEFSTQPLTNADKKAGFKQVAVYAAPPAENEELARLRAENARLTEALLFYADEDTYNEKYETEPCGCCGPSRIDIDEDQGETARAALAASPAPAAIQTKVKALIWHKHPDGSVQADAADNLGLYRIHPNGDAWYLNQEYMGEGGTSAAQADFEHRILSAIEGEGDE